MLMPAAVLVVFVLAAIAIDQSLVFMRQRELVTAAQAAANDAAGYGLDADRFHETNEIVFDLGRAQQAATASLDARHIDAEMSVTLDAAREHVLVVLSTKVPSLFASAVPGAADETSVTARASAELISG